MISQLRLLQLQRKLGFVFLPLYFLSLAFAFQQSATLLHADESAFKEVVLDSLDDVHRFGPEHLQGYKPYKRLWDFMPPIIQHKEQTDELKLAYKRAYVEYVKTGVISEKMAAEIFYVAEGVTEAQVLARPLKYKKLQETVQGHIRFFRPDLETAFKRYDRYRADTRIPIHYIKVIRFSETETIPGLLDNLNLWYGTGNNDTGEKDRFRVEHRYFPLGDYEKTLDKYSDELKNIVKAAVVTSPEDQSFKDRLLLAISNVRLHMLYSFGVLKGVTLVQAVVANRERTARDKVIEGVSTVGMTVGLSWFLHKALLSRVENHDLVNVWLPLIVNIPDKLFFTYMQRPVSAFFGQGVSYNYRTGKWENNVKFFLSAVLLNSIFLRSALEFTKVLGVNVDPAVGDPNTFALSGAAIGTAALFALKEGVGSSLRGMMSKAPFQIWIERLRSGMLNRPLAFVGLLTAFNFVWGMGQVGDMLNMKVSGVHVRDIMTGAALFGASIDSWKHRDYFVRKAKQLWLGIQRIVTGERNPCRVLVVMTRAKDPALDELLQ